jgi:hypothetical protein
MKLLLLIICVIATTAIQAQNNLVVFTQESKPFYVIVNGIRQNIEPETNITVENLPGEFYRIKVVFSDGETPDVDKSVNFMEQNHEYSLEVKEKRGKYKMRFAGARPIDQSNNEGTAVTYHDTDVNTSNDPSAEGEVYNSTSTQNTETSTTTVENGSIDVNVQMSENGVSMQVNVPDDQTEINTGTQQTTVNQTSTTTDHQFIATGTMCSSSNVSNKDFIDFKYTLENANMFNRQELILSYFNSHCMLSQQVAGLIEIDYSTVDAKKIAKQGYRYTYDTENYGLVIAALSSNSDKEEVLTFIGAGTTSNGSNVQINSSATTTVNNSSTSDNAPNNTSNTQYSQLPSYAGYVNCNTTVTSDVSEIYNTASEEAFAEGQKKTIEMATNNQCLSVEQIAKLSSIFSHESDQLNFMKWAFNKTYDIDNFYKLASELTFSSNKEALNKFIDEQPTSHFSYVYSTSNNSGMLIDDQDLKERMEEESFADDKLALAKQALVSRYISVGQVKNIMSVFSHEGDVLEFLKMAYPRTSDKDQFYTLRSKLTFASNKEEFDKIIE